MRNKTYKILQKYLHRVGIYTQYYPSDKAIHYHLKSKPIIIQNYELNKVCKTIKASKNHKFYNSLLKRFVPLWSVEISEASFHLGGGGGESSLNCFRRVKINDSIYFEKVYFKDNEDLKKVKWFHQNVAQFLNSYGVVVPPLCFMDEGKAFVIVYFEYLNLKKLENSEFEVNFISLAKQLYHATLDLKISKTDIPDYIKDFRNHFEYRNKIVQAKLRLSNWGLSAQQIEKDVVCSKLILTHGDIQKRNSFQNYMLIDWDTFGLYPIGFDLAFSFFRLLETQRIKTLSFDRFEKEFKNDIDIKYWDDFERNFNYFLFIFLATYFKNDRYQELELSLVEKIRGRGFSHNE